MNNDRTLYKEVKNIRSKEGEEEGASPAPLFSESAVGSQQSAVIPGTEGFDLLKRIGKPAAQIWTSVQADQLFGDKAPLAIEWMECRCAMGRPMVTHQEFNQLAKLYASHTAAEIRIMIDYSAGKYPDLYTDAIKKAQKNTTPNRLNLNPKPQEYTTTPSGLKILTK